jgi:hypothetical protein
MNERHQQVATDRALPMISLRSDILPGDLLNQ